MDGFLIRGLADQERGRRRPHRAGRPAAERTTLYEIRRRYDVPVAAA